MRRPAQVYPWIMPLIDGPDTPSYPSSHSLQSHLITGMLKLALTPEVAPFAVAAGAPPSVNPFPKSAAEMEALTLAAGLAYPQTAKALDILAYRVAENREIAGVHYNMDSNAGSYAALICLQQLYAAAFGGVVTAPKFRALVAAAKAELQDLP
jgi:hypothetical protein